MVIQASHTPVLVARVLDFLIKDETGFNKKIVDCTLGLGGYSEKFLETFPEARVYALDRDLQAIEAANDRLLKKYTTRFTAYHANFGGMKNVLDELAPFDAFVFDLGVSNMQLTKAERGFSFQREGPLDMRMDSDGAAPTAADILNSFSAEELAKIFWIYGEERNSRRIAERIEERRKRKNFLTTTGELVELIREAFPAPVQRKMGAHPARRVFQALRIYVNDELGELERGLSSVEGLSSHGAKIIVVSYHSLEDRIVKQTFRLWEEEKKGAVLTRHPVVPDPEEIEKNFKARSAKLRAFQFSAGD